MATAAAVGTVRERGTQATEEGRETLVKSESRRGKEWGAGAVLGRAAQAETSRRRRRVAMGR